jgi:hypothetical protein
MLNEYLESKEEGLNEVLEPSGKKALQKSYISSKEEKYPGDQMRKNKVSTTKKVYSVCASYHQGLNILAISLIDREIKLYKLRQNGAKLMFMDYFSFFAKHIVTCLHIEQYVVNSRPILCLGKANGDISIFYIDEPATSTGSLEELKRADVSAGGKETV